jgi:hypothetical protein
MTWSKAGGISEKYRDSNPASKIAENDFKETSSSPNISTY